MLYSKNGSIPKPQTDGTDGWVEVPEPPVAPAGKEVVWWCPPGWVVRDLKPAATETTDFSWSQSQEQWVEYTLPVIITTEEPEQTELVFSSATASETIVLATATGDIEIGSAGPN